MFKIFRYAFLTAGLILTLSLVSSTPAHASFNAVCSITANGLPTIQMLSDNDGGVTFYVQTPQGNARFFQMRPAGGHWEIHSMHDLPDGTALQLDSNGYPDVIQD